MQSSLVLENELNTCIQAIQEHGLSIEECLSRFPAHRSELEPLLRVVVRLQAARSIRAPQAFRQVAAERMQRLIAASPRQQQRPAPWRVLESLLQVWRDVMQGSRVPRFAAVLSIILIVSLLLGTSAVYASAQSLPGDPLYPVKIGIESTQLLLATDDMQMLSLRMTFADRRLQEASLLLKKRSAHAQTAITRYNAELSDALKPLHDPDRISAAGEQSLVSMLDARLTQQQRQIEVLLEEIPGSDAAARQALEQARLQVEQGRSLAHHLLGQPDGVPAGTPPLPTSISINTSTPTHTPSATPTPTATVTPVPTATAWPTFPTWPTVIPATTPRPWPTWVTTPTIRIPWPTWVVPPGGTPIVPPGWPTWPVLPSITPGTTPPPWPTPHMWPTPSVWPTFPPWPSHPPIPTPRAHSTPSFVPTPRSWPTARSQGAP